MTPPLWSRTAPFSCAWEMETCETAGRAANKRIERIRRAKNPKRAILSSVNGIVRTSVRIKVPIKNADWRHLAGTHFAQEVGKGQGHRGIGSSERQSRFF